MNLIVDYRIDEEEFFNLTKLKVNVIKCPPCKKLYTAVCGHPDMLVHVIKPKHVVAYKNIPEHFTNKLKSIGAAVVLSQSELISKYPYDIAFNALNFSKFFVHKLQFTDKKILEMLKDKKMINVNQGYTKCSTAVINDNAVITSDISIANALILENVDVLLLPPGGIELPGLNYGFIGGTCGLIDKNTIAFYGNLDFYAYGSEVLSFLKKYDVKPIYLRNGKLVDRGSILKI